MIKEILQGRFLRHPLHPMLVHMPVALWPLSLVSDIISMSSGDPFFARASFYMIGIGIAIALLAAVTGAAELIDVPRRTLAMRIGLTHGVLNLLIAGLYLLNFFARGDLSTGSDGVVTSTDLILNVISVGLLMVSGYLGGLLVYEHGVGLRTEEAPSKLDGKLKKVA
ncbi:MAG TPA: DUF2231 domain-containing protein [Bdellovibrionota bacterium]|nr:DUF2231 domain-containing protein [Bdellovibrionota bacterium]